MSRVQDFIYQLEGQQRVVMQFLHELMLSFPEMEDKIRYRVPFYFRKSWVCYLNPKKGDKVELAFLRANELSNENGLLDFKDRTQVAGIEFGAIDEIDVNAISEILHEAFMLDETTPYTKKLFKNDTQ